jgi:hypothetical protein
MTVRCGAADGASDDGQAEETRAEVLAAPAAAREQRQSGKGKSGAGAGNHRWLQLWE